MERVGRLPNEIDREDFFCVEASGTSGLVVAGTEARRCVRAVAVASGKGPTALHRLRSILLGLARRPCGSSTASAACV